jgi:hypothetical protein
MNPAKSSEQEDQKREMKEGKWLAGSRVVEMTPEEQRRAFPAAKQTDKSFPSYLG